MSAATIIVALAALIGSPEPYHWPLELPRLLTSSFAEYRPGRFHAGLDLRTGGIGVPVYAAGGGYISRVRCSPEGYGKAVYLTLEDGNTVVYAHLNDYYDALRGYVNAAQHAARSYEVDLYPAPGRFTVTRGQFIAKSGQTGIGAPHLHYEIRDAAQHPINPRLIGVEWPDDTRPVIHQVLIAPEGPDATVNGGLVPVTLPVRHLGNGRYVCDPVRVRGKIGFGVDLVDPGDGGYRLGIHSMRLFEGGTELFRVRHDALSYENHRNGTVAYHPYLLDKGRFLLLWRWPGNVCPSYRFSPSNGLLTAPEQAREVRIEVADFLDNTAAIAIPLVPDEINQNLTRAAGNGRGEVTLECYGNALWVGVRFTAPEGEAPVLRVARDGDTAAVSFLRTGERAYQARFVPTVSGQYTLRVRHPRVAHDPESVWAFLRDAGEASVMLGDVRLHVYEQSPYGVLFARAAPPAGLAPSQIPRRGPARRLWPGDAPIDTAVELAFPMPAETADPTRLAVYRMVESAWVWQHTRRVGERLNITTKRFGTYAIFEDDRAPAIINVRPPDAAPTTTRRPAISATVTDIGSGIADIEVTCGGMWLLTAYDPEHRHIEWEQDEDLPPGPQTITIAVTDRAGNTSTVTRSVQIPE